MTHTHQSFKGRQIFAFTLGMIDIDGQYFKDSLGRTLNLRGVNLSGSGKLVKISNFSFILSHPSPTFLHMANQLTNFFESEKSVSFVNRPFPLNEADEHLARLRLWGFNFIRLNVTWEALEHAGPGEYDVEFFEYVKQLLVKLKEYGMTCFIDPHQDVWSRFSGGSGAPGWTLRAAGLEPMNFKATENTHDDPLNFPMMIWATNYCKLACATMFTLFFGGETFAPDCKIGGVNIQHYLQDHYVNAFVELIKHIALEPGLLDEVVIGYDTLNEPSPGWIGVKDITHFPEFELRKGSMPTPFQAILLGSGHAAKVEVWDMRWYGPTRVGKKIVDPKGVSAWKSVDGTPTYSFTPEKETGCIWAQHGVWDPLTKTCLLPNYFATHPVTKKPIHFLEDFWVPFVERFMLGIRSVHKEAIMFIEPPVNEAPPPMERITTGSNRFCYAPHWYDGLTLINKTFNSWFTIDFIGVKRGNYLGYPTALKFGERGIKECFKSQLNTIRDEGRQHLGNFPCIIGEIGIPYDMDDKAAYKSGVYSSQVKAMDANFYALETNMLNFTLWNYAVGNSHTHGDEWNGEDLSIFSRVKRKMSSFLSSPALQGLSSVQLFDHDKRDSGVSQLKLSRRSSRKIKKFPSDLNLGGRALEAICRPYPVALAGTTDAFSFTMKTGVMHLRFSHNASKTRVSELFLPHLQYPFESEIMFISDDQKGTFTINYKMQQALFECGCDESKCCQHTIVVKNAGLKDVGGIHYYDEKMMHGLLKRGWTSDYCAIL